MLLRYFYFSKKQIFNVKYIYYILLLLLLIFNIILYGFITIYSNYIVTETNHNDNSFELK